MLHIYIGNIQCSDNVLKYTSTSLARGKRAPNSASPQLRTAARSLRVLPEYWCVLLYSSVITLAGEATKFHHTVRSCASSKEGAE